MRLIYLSPVPWSSFSQRPHELVRYFHSATGSEVLWLDPYPGRFPTLSDAFNQRPESGHMNCDVPAWLSVVKPRALPIEPLPFSGAINRLFWRNVEQAIDRFTDGCTILGIGKPTTLALYLLSKRCFSSSFYDAMDNYPAFYKGCSRVAMAERERKIIQKVSMIITSSSALQDRLQHFAGDVRQVLNACAVDRLPEMGKIQQRTDNQAPVIGYMGTIGDWFDWKIVINVAKSNPRASVRLIGPIYASQPSSLPRNVYLEPAVSHLEAIQAMGQFDIGLIPFKHTALTAFVDPIKFYEYRAMGLPIISSAFGEMLLREKHSGIYLVNHDSDMSNVINQALAYRAIPESVVQFRKTNSWESRFDQAAIFSSPNLAPLVQEGTGIPDLMNSHFPIALSSRKNI